MRSNLKEHPVRLAHIQAAKPIAVDFAAVRNFELVQPIRPGIVIGVNTAKCDVMNTARTLLNRRQIRLHSDVQLRMRTAAAHLEHMYPRGGIVGMWTIAYLAHVKNAREKNVCRTQCRHADYNRAKSSDLPFTPELRFGPIAPADRL